MQTGVWAPDRRGPGSPSNSAKGTNCLLVNCLRLIARTVVFPSKRHSQILKIFFPRAKSLPVIGLRTPDALARTLNRFSPVLLLESGAALPTGNSAHFYLVFEVEPPESGGRDRASSFACTNFIQTAACMQAAGI
jgi:hypothetical protein